MKKIYFPNWVDDSTRIGQNTEDIKFKLKNTVKKRFTWFPDNKMKFNEVLWLQVSTKLGMWSSIILEPRLFTSHWKH